jgi:glyoxylase-like metal-dependent hydrolase (beta-lactamase superfamily II)
MTQYDAPTPEKGGMVQLADDLYWARFDLPFRLNHINIYILDAGDSWIVLDTGVGDDNTAQGWEKLLSGPMAGKPVSQLIVSHYHVDHIGYSGPLVARTGAKAFASRDEIEIALWLNNMAGEDFAVILADRYRSFGLDDVGIATGRDDGNRYRNNVSYFPDFKELNVGDTVRSLNGTWHVDIEAGHSPAQISLHDRDRSIYIAVDFLLPRITPNISANTFEPERDFLGDYFSYLNKIKDTLTDDTLVLPGHDWPFTGGPARAEELIDHHHFRLNQIMERAADGPMTVADGMKVLFDREFGPHELFFATGETAAHMIYLVTTGRLTTEDRGGVTFYKKA